MIIGLHGPMQSGKDTTCEILREVHDGRVTRRAFADPLKLSAYRCFNPEGTLEEALEWADKMKKQGYVDVTSDTGEGFHLTGRQLLQNYGTEAHREVFGTDFWVDASLPRWDGMGHTEQSIFGTHPLTDFVVFTDVRFPNEAKRIKEWGGIIWRIQRDAVEVGVTHASEVRLRREYIDYTVENNGTLDELRSSVLTLLDDIRSVVGSGQSS